MFALPAPVESFRFAGRIFHVKRDDLIHPDFSGNKYRKLYRFIHMPSEALDSIVSYGGIQSNAMLSIAALCHLKGWRFEYICKTVPKYLRDNPTGNYRRSLELGMQLNEVVPTQYHTVVGALNSEHGTRRKIVPQGGADPAAKEGVRVLAEEIREWQREHAIEILNVVTPSGTGTTAAFLAAALPECRVLTVAAVGDAAYLERQIDTLMPLPPNLQILSTPYRFATPHPELLNMYEELKASGIEFDLIYAPVMWKALLENMEDIEGEVLYVHSGGVSGNETMLARYARL